jgi:hypothetical protein
MQNLDMSLISRDEIENGANGIRSYNISSRNILSSLKSRIDIKSCILLVVYSKMDMLRQYDSCQSSANHGCPL